MSLDEQFTSAQDRVKTLTTRPSNQDLLELYALFKQATSGDVQGSKPSRFDLKGRAKWDAWSAKSGQSSDTAKQNYVALVDKLVG